MGQITKVINYMNKHKIIINAKSIQISSLFVDGEKIGEEEAKEYVKSKKPLASNPVTIK
jgi:hypothetical protein